MQTAFQREKIGKVLGRLGLAGLNEPSALFDQMAYLVPDEAAFKRLLDKCEPAERATMYASLVGRLRFKVKPLDVYTAEMAGLAEQKQLPIIGKDGTLLPFRPAVVESDDYRANIALKQHMDEHKLRLTCKKCTRWEEFTGERRIDAIHAARSAGWAYSEVDKKGIEICPKCPGGGLN